MHPDLEQLLAIRDGGEPEGVREHLAACPDCSAELERLRRVAESLRALPPVPPPKDLWPGLRDRLATERSRRWIAFGLIAASVLLLASVAAVVLLPRLRQGKPEPARQAQQVAAPQASDLQPLISQSQQLEGLLRKASTGTPVLSGKAAGTIANLEDGIAILDFKISLLKDTSDQHDQLKKLWQQRVKMLQALVQVRTSRGEYAQL